MVTLKFVKFGRMPKEPKESETVLNAILDALHDIKNFYESRDDAVHAFEAMKKLASDRGGFSSERLKSLFDMLDSIAGSMES